jgi:hypothetical protein
MRYYDNSFNENALIPIITMVGLEFGHLLGGAVIIEPFRLAGNWQTADRLHLSERYPGYTGDGPVYHSHVYASKLHD